MMMGGDRKKLAALIVSRVKPEGDFEQMRKRNQDGFSEMAKEPEAPEPLDEGLKATADEMLSAIHTRDAEGLGRALKDFFSQCDGDESGDGSPEEAGDESAS